MDDARPSSGPPAEILLHHLLESETDLDRAFDELRRRRRGGGQPIVRAVVPPDVLADQGASFEEFVASVLQEYDEIEAVLADFREHEPTAEERRRAARGSGAEEAGTAAPAPTGPEDLARALEPLATDAERFDLLLGQARDCLARLESYRLSRRDSDSLLEVLERRDNLWTVQYLVEFLRSLHRAADSFESLELPRPHIRDYLSHLYRMKDWSEMSRLVRLLERAVLTRRSEPSEDFP